MPDRKILLALMTYVDEDGLDRFGLQGETVKVKSSYVEHFDALNIDPGPPFEPERVPVETVAPGGAEKAQPQPRKATAKKAE